MNIKIISLLLVLAQSSAFTQSRAPWTADTYPDESGFTRRMAPMLERIAARGFATRTKASSRCPDTGLPVRSWALEGETIISPYTGRAYVQGPTGYFGPRARNKAGQITAFGGDPLKYDLPPATASLLLDQKNVEARSYLSIPASLSQQYHFACKHWARFYPLLGDAMGAEWRAAFREAVYHYREPLHYGGEPGGPKPLSVAHTLPGEAGTLLGGNSIDGGTENHKTMWRTSCLVYAQLFPEGAKISSYPLEEARNQCQKVIREYLQLMLRVGNGEYDSEVYYPHTIEGFLNLYDFSTDPENKALAKMALDYYFATYALKTIDGAIAGGQKRGYLPGSKPDEMETMLWGFFDATSRPMASTTANIHQATTTYRPNKIIHRLATGQVDLPFEARMSRPFYHMDRYNAFQESFYRSSSFGLGNVNMTIVDNPNQQMVWSLVTTGSDGPLGFTGGQPHRLTSSGHSPYTQTVHSKGTLLLLSAPTGQPKAPPTAFEVSQARHNPWHLPDSAQSADFEYVNRLHYAPKPLQTVDRPDVTSAESLLYFWQQKKYTAASWLLIPKAVEERREETGRVLFRAHKTFVAVRPFQKNYYILSPNSAVVEAIKDRTFRRILQQYDILVVPGEISGFVLEAVEASTYGSLNAFSQALDRKTQLDLSLLKTDQQVRYHSIYGEQIDMMYQPLGLRAETRIDGKLLDYDTWADGAVYDSPYLKVKDGVMKISDGNEAYQVDFRGERPDWTEVKGLED